MMSINREEVSGLLKVAFPNQYQLDKYVDEIIAAEDASRKSPSLPSNENELRELEAFATEHNVMENNWFDFPKPNCNWCVAMWAVAAAAIAAYAAATGGIGVVALGQWIITTYGTSSTVAHAMAAAALSGGGAGAIAYAACPQCK